MGQSSAFAVVFSKVKRKPRQNSYDLHKPFHAHKTLKILSFMWNMIAAPAEL